MNSREVINLKHNEARSFFMKNSSYINFDIPDYLNFEKLLTSVSFFMGGKELVSVCIKEGSKIDKPSNYERVNHIILSNKDGAYSWRPMQIIHPVLYVYLIKLITEKKNWEYIQSRFNDFSNTCISCISIPRESDDQSDKASQVRYWWERIEQYSIKKSLEYNYVFITDISDCYGSIYTHSIEWALDKDGREEVKERLRKGVNIKTLGKSIDFAIRSMNYNQTNGIPQGSTLMDFIAEIVLGYTDENLTKSIEENKVKKKDYHIIRYRDDYRIFVNDPNIGHEILKLLSAVLYEMGLKLNSAKTMDSNDVILSSVKREKLERISIAPSKQSLQKEALRIYQLSKKYPNSGLLVKELSLFYDSLSKFKKYKHQVDLESVIVILVMIATSSPRVINWVSAAVSIFLEHIENSKQRKELVRRIHNKFNKIPQTGLIDIWLQRISEPLGISIDYSDNLTKVAVGKIKNSKLWSSQWLNQDVIDLIDLAKVSNLNDMLKKKSISPVIKRAEVELFRTGYF